MDPEHDAANCSSGGGEIEDQVAKLEFVKNVRRVVSNVTAVAVADGGYGVVEVGGGAVRAYALAQCWKTVNSSGCRACLEKAGDEVMGCLPAKEGRGLNAGCYLRYSTEKFYGNEGESKANNGKDLRYSQIFFTSLTFEFKFLFLDPAKLPIFRFLCLKLGSNLRD